MKKNDHVIKIMKTTSRGETAAVVTIKSVNAGVIAIFESNLLFDSLSLEQLDSMIPEASSRLISFAVGEAEKLWPKATKGA